MLKRCQQIFEQMLRAEQFGASLILSQTQFELLSASALMPYQSQASLGRALGIDKASVTAATEALVKFKLVNRRQPTDRRRRLLFPSKRSMEVVKREMGLRSSATLRFLAPLSSEDGPNLMANLHQLAAAECTSAPAWQMPTEGKAGAPLAEDWDIGRLFDSPEFLLRRCCQVVRGLNIQAIPDEQFTEGQAQLLYLLCANGQMSMPALQYAFERERPTLLLVLNNLIKRRFAKQTVDPSDRRRKLVEATPAGNDAIAGIFAIWEEIEASIAAILTPEHHDRFRQLLIQLTDARTLSADLKAPDTSR